MIELYKYTLVNSTVFIIDIILLYILTEIFNFYYLWSAFFALVIGFTINYFFNVRWVFDIRKYSNNPVYEYFLMALISGFVSSVNLLGIWFFTEFLQVYYILSKMIISFFTFVLKFVLRKKIVFQI